jgi:hypothetical protein
MSFEAVPESASRGAPSVLSRSRAACESVRIWLRRDGSGRGEVRDVTALSWERTGRAAAGPSWRHLAEFDQLFENSEALKLKEYLI